MCPNRQNGSRCKSHPCSKAPHTGKDSRQQEQRTQHQSGKKKNTSHMVSHNTPLSVQRTCAEMMFCTVYQKILNRV